MKKLSHRKLYIALLAGALLLSPIMPAQAQDSVRGQYNPKAPRAKDEPTQAPIPKVFSSKIQHSILQALKADALLHNLKIALWNYAQVGYAEQASLLDKLQNQNFQTTRYKAEFTRDLEKAMRNLNKSYKGMREQVSSAQPEYQNATQGITSLERETLDPLWKDNIDALNKRSETYFKLQHQYLMMYKELAAFILSKNGSFIYDNNTRSLRFFDIVDYTYFAGTIDKLNAISKKQQQLLKDLIPNSEFLLRKEEDRPLRR